MTSSPKAKRAPAKTTLQNLELLAAYHAVAFFAKTFEWPFWFFEQWRGRLMDRIDTDRGDEP